MNFQTIEQFIQAPFGEPELKSNEMESKYKSLKSSKRIEIAGFTTVDDNYFLHLKIGSDTNENQSYDVIVMFFTDDEKVKSARSLQNYYIKFFSNSPSFIYQYAALYKKNGFLIDMLYDKLDPEYADKMPNKRNSSMKLSYDKSIYSACRYLWDERFVVLNKFGILLTKKKKEEDFFRDIRDFTDVKFTQELNNLDKKINKELETQKKRKKEEKRNRRSNTKSSVKIIKPTRSILNKDSKPGVNINNKKSNVIKPKPKKRAGLTGKNHN